MVHKPNPTPVTPTVLAGLLEKCDRTDLQVAVFCEINPSQLSLYRTGARWIHDKHALRLATYFGITVDELRSESRPAEVPEGPDLIAPDWIE